ncbi:hypothetical protein GCM10011512_28660 [Tersicoccus solisilvae]|uniref:D-inositol 3-phosphate glycosyltransferase n=1 Tax=Tersicoccus solisilvae TaxID=1882339 RepID=A0ABQ1PN48_9MICC|nr:glycosyltransferase family 4 protein [Tersicoccus solisilvae]GGD00068.1 hypothetical protein GCM10011512_28660 [Tersicoccus solisilvae]
MSGPSSAGNDPAADDDVPDAAAGTAPARLEVVFPPQLDPTAWQRRHAVGEVPSRWPYGLDGLRAWASRTTPRTLPPSGSLRARAGRLLPRVTAAPRPGTRDIGMCWDENVAVAMTRLARRPEMFCGVIWVTDRHGPPDGAARATLHALRAMTGVWVISRAQVEPLRELVGPDGPRVSFVRFGVDGRFFGLQPYPDRPVVVSLGNDRHRDVETTLAALRLVKQRRPATELVVQTRSAAPGSVDGMTVVDRLTHRQVRELYGRASVVAVATRPNLHGSGMTVGLESLASGRPVVVTGSPGLEDYVEDGRTGLLTAPSDPAALADAVVDLLDDPDRACAMGVTGRHVVEERMTTEHLVRGLAGVLGLAARPEG